MQHLWTLLVPHGGAGTEHLDARWLPGTPENYACALTRMLGCAARRCTQEPPPPPPAALLAPFVHVYPSLTTLCCSKIVWGQSTHDYAPFGG